MHSCHNCGMACYCSGDIEDHDTGNEYVSRCTCCSSRFDDESDELVMDCGYPGCCMPGEHFRHECHNAEDLMNQERAAPAPSGQDAKEAQP